MRDELWRLLDRLVKIRLREDEAAAVLIGIVVGPDGFFNGRILIKQAINIGIILQLRNLHLLLHIRLDFFLIELYRRHAVCHHSIFSIFAKTMPNWC